MADLRMCPACDYRGPSVLCGTCGNKTKIVKDVPKAEVSAHSCPRCRTPSTCDKKKGTKTPAPSKRPVRSCPGCDYSGAASSCPRCGMKTFAASAMARAVKESRPDDAPPDVFPEYDERSFSLPHQCAACTFRWDCSKEGEANDE